MLYKSAVIYTTIHQLFAKGGHSSWEIVSYLFFFSTIIGAIQMIYDFHWPDTREWIILIGIAIVSLIAQVWMTQAYGTANQVLVSFIMYLGVFLNMLWGAVFFDEEIGFMTASGGILIIGSSIFLTLHREKSKN